MSCSECDKCRALGYKFCIKCGQSFADSAIVPEHTVDNGSILSEPSLTKMAVPATIVFLIAVIISVGIMLIEFAPLSNTSRPRNRIFSSTSGMR